MKKDRNEENKEVMKEWNDVLDGFVDRCVK